LGSTNKRGLTVDSTSGDPGQAKRDSTQRTRETLA
jgi:hypothetical protein